LQFEINKTVADADKIAFASQARQLFAQVMDTGTDHISISIRECGTYDLSIGRVTDPGQGVALVNADLRQGRTIEQRRTLVLGFIELLQKILSIPPDHVYVTLTEHQGADFHLAERYLADWKEGEDPLTDH